MMTSDHRGIPRREPAPNRAETPIPRANKASDYRQRLCKRSSRQAPAGNAATIRKRKDRSVLRITRMPVQCHRNRGAVSPDFPERRHILRLERFVTRTEAGPLWAKRTVPTPMFVSSDLAYGIQAADVCIYCINRGYRQHLKEVENADGRPEIAERFARDLARLQYRGIDYRGGCERIIEGIFLEHNPNKQSC